ncbi:MBL fold metallo-hydrolase [Chryseobacterium sp. 3008163]|uniref:MBL fold metallo-hydrolase n=1 Tax=Chryseobacterium sp. 3008163 TaxID=2478663 RepID=UPI0021CF8188|nr:MBL fold metallo-hydrolase [Chryseobacterium sp. 3008163]
MFQGIKSLREQNWQPLNLDIAETDIVILTHTHLDHCGYIPLLVKNGFKVSLLEILESMIK